MRCAFLDHGEVWQRNNVRRLLQGQRAFAEWLDEQPLEVLKEVAEGLRQSAIAMGINVDEIVEQENAMVVDDNPEEIAHADQHDIDTTFFNLMEGIEL